MTTLVRAASLTHFASAASACGLNAAALVAEAGLPVQCLADPDLKVPSAAVARLLELAAERGHEPAFALRLVASRRLSNLGPLGLLLRDEPTLRSALEALVRHIHLHNEALVLSVEQAGQVVVIRAELAGAGAQPLRQATELVLGVTFRVLGLFLGTGWHPRLVCFAHRAPANTAVHRRLFGDALAFGHEFNGIVCSAANLDAPNPGADPVMARYAQSLFAQGLRTAAPGGPPRLADSVRQLVVLLLPRGHCRVERVAQHLGLDRRTVARRLLAEGTSFSALVDQLRAELLARYADDGTRTLADISALLGFSAPSAFSRWHRAQFGVAARVRWAAAQRRAACVEPRPARGVSRQARRRFGFSLSRQRARR